MTSAVVKWILGRISPFSLVLLMLLLSIVPGQWMQITRYDQALTAVQQALDEAQAARDRCSVTRSSLELQVQDQNKALQDLRSQTDARQVQAAALIAKAQADARQQYRAAQQLLLERSDGDDCTIAGVLIDRELGL